MKERDLADLFRKLGARNPEVWARSQVKEGLPQLARFVFLRQAWKLVVAERDRSWLSERANDDQRGPGGAIGPALKRLLALGASEDDLTAVARVMQWRVLSGLCYLLDDPGDLESEVKDIAWRLFQVDENDQPIAAISGLTNRSWKPNPAARKCAPREDELPRMDKLISARELVKDLQSALLGN